MEIIFEMLTIEVKHVLSFKDFMFISDYHMVKKRMLATRLEYLKTHKER